MKYSSQEGLREEIFFFSFSFNGEPFPGLEKGSEKHEIRNSKQIQIVEPQNSKLEGTGGGHCGQLDV
jgi:hypothetical protein